MTSGITVRSIRCDKNHTGLSPLRITVIHDFVLTFDRVSPGGSMVIGLINGTYFPVDLVFYLRKFKYLVLKLRDSCRNFHPYGSYVLATPLLPYLRTGYASTFQATLHDLPWPTTTYYAYLPC